MEITAVIVTAVTGFLSALFGGGVVWKMISRWMDDVDKKFAKTFDWLERTGDTFTKQTEHIRCSGELRAKMEQTISTDECEKCSAHLAEKRQERGERIAVIEKQQTVLTMEVGELWGVIGSKFPDLDRRKTKQ